MAKINRMGENCLQESYLAWEMMFPSGEGQELKGSPRIGSSRLLVGWLTRQLVLPPLATLTTYMWRKSSPDGCTSLGEIAFWGFRIKLTQLQNLALPPSN